MFLCCHRRQYFPYFYELAHNFLCMKGSKRVYCFFFQDRFSKSERPPQFFLLIHEEYIFIVFHSSIHFLTFVLSLSLSTNFFLCLYISSGCLWDLSFHMYFKIAKTKVTFVRSFLVECSFKQNIQIIIFLFDPTAFYVCVANNYWFHLPSAYTKHICTIFLHHFSCRVVSWDA